jgi:hypothetical protein
MINRTTTAMGILALWGIRILMKSENAAIGINGIRMSMVGWVSTSKLLSLFLLLTLPAVAQAQFAYEFSNGTITITGYSGPGGAVVIPSEVNGVPVVSIGDGAFSVCNTLTSIVIPDSITNIGTTAFSSLESNGDLGLTNVVIGNGVTTIGDEAFYRCPRLATVVMGSSVTTIGYGAFEGCYSLNNIALPDSLISVDTIAFSGCTSLTNVTMGKSVNSIGNVAFSGCTGLVSLTLPKGLSSLGNGAFDGCTSLTAAYFQGNVPGYASTVFSDDNYTTVYYFPGTTGWGPFFANRPTALWNAQVQPGSFGIQTNQFGFNITGSSNLVIVIEASTNLANPTWFPLQTNILNGDPLYFTDPQRAIYNNRFYRVTWP